MDSKRNIKKTIISTIYWQYPQKANRLFPWAVIFIAFLFFIMAFVTPAHLQADYTFHFGTAVEIQGDYAYAAVTGTSHSATDVIYMTPPPPELPSGLRVIEISDPSDPKIIGGLDYSNSGMLCITVEGDLVYLSYSGAEGVKIIDISNPEKPKIIGTIKNVYAREMVVRDGYAYLAKESVIIIVDVSNPANPSRKEIWHLPGMPPYAHVPSTEKLAGSGEYIYVTGDVDNQEELLFVVNISDPLNPDLLGEVSIYRPNGIAVQGDYACIVGLDGFQIIDISDPDDPSVVGKVESTRQSSSGWGTSGYGYGSPYFPGPYQSYPGFRYGYPLGGFGTSGGYGYPISGFGTSGGYGYGYPFSGFGTSGGYGYPPGWRPF